MHKVRPITLIHITNNFLILIKDRLGILNNSILAAQEPTYCAPVDSWRLEQLASIRGANDHLPMGPRRALADDFTDVAVLLWAYGWSRSTNHNLRLSKL